MNKLRNTKLWETVLIILLLCIVSGCTKFKRDDPSSVGVFYPYQPIQGEYFTKDNFGNSENKISFSQPAKIKAVGKMTWNSLMGNYYETALISPKLDHLPGDYWIHTEGDYFATISWLQANGRIEYTGSKTSGDYFWEGVVRFLTSTVGLVIEIILIIIIVIAIFRRRASKSSAISAKTSASDYGSGSYSSYYESSDSSYPSYSSYSSEYESEKNYESNEGGQESEESSISGGTRRCTDCQSIDLSGWGFTSKGNGRCKECDGTGHDRLTEAIVQFGTLGLEDGKYNCKTCYGTGQCQTCGGTGVVFK